MKLRRVAREERHARLVLPARDVLHRDRLDDHGRDAVDETGAACLDALRVAFREVPRTGGVAPGGERRPDTLCGDDLVGLAERGNGCGADRVTHRVAGRERCRDDRGTEHQADDDQRAAAAAATDVANAEPQEDTVAERQRRDCGKHDREDDDEGGGKPADRDAEKLAHGLPPHAWLSAGTSAIETS